MATFLTWPLALAGALLLVAAGLGHVRRPHLLGSALRAQRALPDQLLVVTAAVLGPVECALGGAVLATSLLLPSCAPVPLAAQAAIYLVFAGQLWRVNRERPGVPCGCFGTGEPVGWPAVGRAVVLGLGSVGAVLSPPPDAQGRLLLPLGGAVIAMAAWLISAVPWTRRPPSPR